MSQLLIRAVGMYVRARSLFSFLFSPATVFVRSMRKSAYEKKYDAFVSHLHTLVLVKSAIEKGKICVLHTPPHVIQALRDAGVSLFSVAKKNDGTYYTFSPPQTGTKEYSFYSVYDLWIVYKPYYGKDAFVEKAVRTGMLCYDVCIKPFGKEQIIYKDGKGDILVVDVESLTAVSSEIGTMFLLRKGWTLSY